MSPTRALAFLINFTSREWKHLETDELLQLWAKFREYIRNGFRDTSRVEHAWEQCKKEIENYLTTK